MSNWTNGNCESYDWYRVAGDEAYLPEYYIITPFYLVLGSLGHSILLWALCQQIKKHVAYYYQVFVAVSELLEITLYAIYIATFVWWSGAVHVGAGWYMSCYGCMWFAAHLATPMVNSLVTNTLFLTVCMSADRLLAVLYPFDYHSANHKARQIVAVISTLIIGFGSSVFDCFRFHVEPSDEGGGYQVVFDMDFVESTTGEALAQFRNALRILAMFALITCNTFLILIYRRRTRKVEPRRASQNGVNKTRNDDIDKTLIRLTVFQSLFNGLGMSCLTVWYVAIYVLPRFYICEALLWAPLADAMFQITDMADFFAMLIVSRRIRKMICLSLPYVRKWFIVEQVQERDQ